MSYTLFPPPPFAFFLLPSLLLHPQLTHHKDFKGGRMPRKGIKKEIIQQHTNLAFESREPMNEQIPDFNNGCDVPKLVKSRGA
jgi:hypothetical protein